MLEQNARLDAKLSPYSEIETLIRARYPLIYVASWEETRALRELNAIARQLRKRLYTWSINDGIRVYQEGLGLMPEAKKGTKDPVMALREIMQQSDPSIYVLRDFHAFIKEAAVARGLRDLSEILRSSYTSVVLLSPVVEIPPELEKDITIVDYPLPSRLEIGQLLHSIAADVVNNPQLTVELGDGAEQIISDAAIGLTLNEAENVFAKTLVATCRLTAREAPMVYAEKEQIIRKTGLLEYVRVHEDFSEIGGLDQLKQWLTKRKEALSEDARRYGLPAPKGVLILGVQGCGKSLCAKAVPNLWRLPLLRLDMGQIFGSLVGPATQHGRAIQLAESVQPVVIWIDEIDKGFSGLDSSSFSDSGTRPAFSGHVTWLQEKTCRLRHRHRQRRHQTASGAVGKGRFDEIFFVDCPTPKERHSIFKIHLSKRGRTPENYDLAALVKASEEFSGAEIEQGIIAALFDAFSERVEVTTDHILRELHNTVPLARLMPESIHARREWSKGRTRRAT
jgi:SpoVK/Ycf46/Vps4 family AAA+-type ATPase